MFLCVCCDVSFRRACIVLRFESKENESKKPPVLMPAVSTPPSGSIEHRTPQRVLPSRRSRAAVNYNTCSSVVPRVSKYVAAFHFANFLQAFSIRDLEDALSLSFLEESEVVVKCGTIHVWGTCVAVEGLLSTKCQR